MGNKDGWYKRWRIPKRSGGYRTIESPNEELKKDQRNILRMLYRLYGPSKYSFGGVLKKNISMAAEKHVSLKYKLKMDIHDFFHSITGDMVKKALTCGGKLSKDDASNIVYLCTNEDNVLPQGAPTSMLLANIAVKKLYNIIGKWCKIKGVVFTAYVDDLVFSSESEEALIDVSKKIPALCRKFGLTIKSRKTVFMRNKQEILGLCAVPGVNHPRLPRSKRKIIRAMLHNVERSIDNKREKPDRNTLNRLSGLVGFANMAMDQHSGRFNAAILRINQKIKEL